jgi:chemotaxis protein CheD
MERIAISLGEFAVSREDGDVLVAYALGSCVAVAMFDPAAGVCGLAHVVVPGEAPPDARTKPAYHAIDGVRRLVDAMRQMGARSLQVRLAGGAAVIDAITTDVGRRNVLSVRKALWAAGLVAVAEDVGGTESRTVSMEVPSGIVRVRNASRGSWVLEQEQR